MRESVHLQAGQCAQPRVRDLEAPPHLQRPEPRQLPRHEQEADVCDRHAAADVEAGEGGGGLADGHQACKVSAREGGAEFSLWDERASQAKAC